MKINKNPFRSKTTDNNSYAQDSGKIVLSERRLRRFHYDLYDVPFWLFWKPQKRKAQLWHRLNIAEHLYHGDSRAALVVQTRPYLIVAAYTCELDCVALLGFDNEAPRSEDPSDWSHFQYPYRLCDELIRRHNLKTGLRLLTVNCYTDIEEGIAPDLILGPRSRRVYGNVFPLIADFLTEDQDRVEKRKTQISEQEWARVEEKAKETLMWPTVAIRDGRPLFSGMGHEVEDYPGGQHFGKECFFICHNSR